MALSEKDIQWLSNDYRTALAERQAEEAAIDAEIAELEEQTKDGWPADLAPESDLDGIRVLVAVRLIAEVLEDFESHFPVFQNKEGTSGMMKEIMKKHPLVQTRAISRSEQFRQAMERIHEAPRTSKFLLSAMPLFDEFRGSLNAMAALLFQLASHFEADGDQAAARHLSFLGTGFFNADRPKPEIEIPTTLAGGVEKDQGKMQ